MKLKSLLYVSAIEVGICDLKFDQDLTRNKSMVLPLMSCFKNKLGLRKNIDLLVIKISF